MFNVMQEPKKLCGENMLFITLYTYKVELNIKYSLIYVPYTQILVYLTYNKYRAI